MRFGNIEFFTISDGSFRLDGGAMFGRVPKEIWKKTNPADRENRILLGLNCLLIRDGKHNILINTGTGVKHNIKSMQRFDIRKSYFIGLGLMSSGLLPEDIDIVVNTHLHFDHCGGNTKKENGKIIPVFPNAKYIIQRGEWEQAFSGNLLTRASYLQEDFLPLFEQRQIEFIDGNAEIEPGISLVVTGGHTQYHQIVKIESDGKKAIYLSDLVPTVSHLNYPFVMGYDLYPVETLKKKIEIISQAAENHDLLIFEHDPKISMAAVKIEDGRPKLDKWVDRRVGR